MSRGTRVVLFRPSIVNRAVIPKMVNPAYVRGFNLTHFMAAVFAIFHCIYSIFVFVN